MRAELRHDLSLPGRVNEATRAVHHVVERFGGRQAGEHHVGLGADIGCRTRRHAANFFELSERAAAVADDAVAAFNQIIRDRQTDFADADETDGVHSISQWRFQFLAISIVRCPLACCQLRYAQKNRDDSNGSPRKCRPITSKIANCAWACCDTACMSRKRRSNGLLSKTAVAPAAR